MRQGLEGFSQWSDVTPFGHALGEALFASCVVDGETGWVGTREEVTSLVAESYVAAAQVYVLCRVFRYPPRHWEVQAHAQRIKRCIAMLPTSGFLMTAQWPLFSFFVAAVLLYAPEDRKAMDDMVAPLATDVRGVRLLYLRCFFRGVIRELTMAVCRMSLLSAERCRWCGTGLTRGSGTIS